MDRQRSGRDAEALAHRHLAAQGLHLLAQNWRCRCGELDLVMLDGDTVVFVEVRYRRHLAWGGALESVDARKRMKLVRTAQYFLQKEPRWARHPCRFDVVAITNADEGAFSHLNWVRNAFDA
ncbi:YraN family protein [Azotobacter beijerinckii]|uniref:YraN family protein n=1 Tax=Azotobacter beijerinckii TaxID=170623 RepID=UPI002955A017|nr:YraN family protein [Azotobacter beijerinckii]MDV7209700.1 YraN family protein [Azotobacter beijerinckii]